jgi:hypothetical protein
LGIDLQGLGDGGCRNKPIDVTSSEEDIELEEIGKQMDIWKDEISMILLSCGIMHKVLVNVIEVHQAKRKLLNYHWKDDTLFFKNLVVPKPKERKELVKDIHEEIRHFGEGRTLAKVKKKFFWHDKIESVRMVVR